MADASGLSARVVESIASVPASVWDACANPPGAPFDPFISHAFLKALEDSRSVGGRTGWRPMHLLIERAGVVAAAMPLYLKAHSYGEYVFDQAWARAFEQAGGAYYPKLLSAVPFTPVGGRRLLVRSGEVAQTMRSALLTAVEDLAARTRASSVHVNFVTEDEWATCGALGFLRRMDQQFHWRNRGYADFGAFLASLSSEKRKNLRKERRRALDAGIDIRWVTGADLTEAHWDAFFDFYMDTGSRKWGTPYLTRAFFSAVGAAMPERILLVLAVRGGRPIAGALNFIGADALFGRNWGAIEYHPFLHFECCYYQAIDFAIAHGLSRVEAGAQGEHKLIRGYEPAPTYSAHWIAHPGLRRAVSDYLDRERPAVAETIAELARHAPYRKDG